tara:strand:+ start:2850 stop:3320 length:471 start_codon:yes stop_codon:yes gene_type:complete
MEAQKLFYLEDKIMKLPGLYLMWTILFVANFVSLLVDDTQGVSRDFNVWSNAISVIYGSLASVNNIFGNKMPSSMLLIAGPVHQYLHWLLFAYFGGSDVLGSHAVGVMNWISLFVVGIFSIDMIIKTWVIAIYPNYYTDYVRQELQQNNNNNNDNL